MCPAADHDVYVHLASDGCETVCFCERNALVSVDDADAEWTVLEDERRRPCGCLYGQDECLADR
jgi:hypothetical protein